VNARRLTEIEDGAEATDGELAVAVAVVFGVVVVVTWLAATYAGMVAEWLR